MKIKFLADENFRRAIVSGVRRREPAVSFMHAFTAGACGQDDAAVLRIAAKQGRILVSHDLRTMPGHFRQFTIQQPSPGVFLVPQKLAVNAAVEELLIVWAASEAEEWVNRLCYLPL